MTTHGRITCRGRRAAPSPRSPPAHESGGGDTGMLGVAVAAAADDAARTRNTNRTDLRCKRSRRAKDRARVVVAAAGRLCCVANLSDRRAASTTITSNDEGNNPHTRLSCTQQHRNSRSDAHAPSSARPAAPRPLATAYAPPGGCTRGHEACRRLHTSVLRHCLRGEKTLRPPDPTITSRWTDSRS